MIEIIKLIVNNVILNVPAHKCIEYGKNIIFEDNIRNQAPVNEGGCPK